MKIIQTVQDLKQWRQQQQGQSLGFVPTMGALHAGHEKLLSVSQNQNQKTVLSIFVNPTQFNNPEDLKNYPKTWESDLEKARRQQVDVVFAPTATDLYPDQYHYKVDENSFSQILCGAHRPGHFTGVLTVVMKLLNLVQPDRVYLGEKDFQQLELIRGMVQAFFLPVEVIPVATVREADGLAMSSRNTRLNQQQRQLAPEIAKSILESPSPLEARRRLTEKGFQVDYVEDYGQRRYVAASLGPVRLIDNVQI